MYSFLRSVCVAWVLLFPVSALAAGPADTLDKGPKIGERVPLDFRLHDQRGTLRSFASLTGKHGLILLFYRSMEMCPPCEFEMRRWNEHVVALNTLGYGVATISNDTVDSLARVARRSGAAVTLLADPEAKVIGAFGLVDERYPPGSVWYGTAHPIVLVIDRQGTVMRRYSSRHYRERPDIGAIITQLRAPGS